MKVNISRYYSPAIDSLRLAKIIYFWRKPDVFDDNDPIYSLAEKLSTTRIVKWVNKITTPKKDRNISVKIDDSDLWSLDVTLAHVIRPALEKLKEQKQGSPCVDAEDVPENIRNMDIHDQWSWVLDEMIWTFNYIEGDYESHPPYKGDISMNINSDHTLEIDYSDPQDMVRYRLQEKEDMQRCNNGLRLFGKYYTALWN